MGCICNIGKCTKRVSEAQKKRGILIPSDFHVKYGALFSVAVRFILISVYNSRVVFLFHLATSLLFLCISLLHLQLQYRRICTIFVVVVVFWLISCLRNVCCWSSTSCIGPSVEYDAKEVEENYTEENQCLEYLLLKCKALQLLQKKINDFFLSHFLLIPSFRFYPTFFSRVHPRSKTAESCWQTDNDPGCMIFVLASCFVHIVS